MEHPFFKFPAIDLQPNNSVYSSHQKQDNDFQMTKTYKELLAERVALEAQIEAARKKEVASAIEMVKEIMLEYALTAEEIFPTARSTSKGKQASKVEPKYRNPGTHQTWTGRGKPPKWIADFSSEERMQFLI